MNTPKGLDNFSRGVVTAVAGGTASVITGGKFASGAQTAAFGYMFNYLSVFISESSRGRIYQQHVALLIDDPDNPGTRVLYDPGGSVVQRITGGDDAIFAVKPQNLIDYLQYQSSTSAGITHYAFDTTPETERAIIRSITQAGNVGAGFCADEASRVLRSTDFFRATVTAPTSGMFFGKLPSTLGAELLRTPQRELNVKKP
jgi:hypothetical protein